MVDVWKDAFGLGQTAGDVAIQLCGGTALEDITAPDDLGDHVAPEAGTAAQGFDTEDEDGNALTVQSITLKPTPVTQENLNLPIDLGWIEQDVACEGAEDGVAGCE
jgi:D-xylose transport system substrate-binding protein